MPTSIKRKVLLLLYERRCWMNLRKLSEAFDTNYSYLSRILSEWVRDGLLQTKTEKKHKYFKLTKEGINTVRCLKKIMKYKL